MPPPINFDRLRREAAAPATTAERLREIADEVRHGPHGGAAAGVREVLAAQANTPPDLLLDLAPRYPDAFLRNPALLLLPLEDPEFLPVLLGIANRGLLRRPDVPGWIVAWLAENCADPALAQEARLHVSLAGDAPEGGADAEAEARAALWERIALAGPEEREGVLELVEMGVAPAWAGEAAASATPPPGAAAYPVRFGALREACDPATPRARLLALAQGEDPAIRLAVAGNPSAPPSALHNLAVVAGAHRAELRRTAAANPAAGAPLLRRLAVDGDAGVRRAVRGNPSAPPDADGLCREAALRAARAHGAPALCRCFVLLAGDADTAELERTGELSLRWPPRLAAALRLPEGSRLLGALAEDGCRVVRLAARAPRHRLRETSR